MSTVNHPFHYNQYKYEVIELIRQLPFDAGNCVKYIIRAPFKNKGEDLAKAIWYAEDMLSPSSSIMDISFDQQKIDSINEITEYYCTVVRTSDIPCAELFASLLASVVSYSVGAGRGELLGSIKSNIQYLCRLIKNNNVYKRSIPDRAK